MTCSGIWIILKFYKLLCYYCYVIIIHIQIMLLFVYNRNQEIFGIAQETLISLRLRKQNQASVFVKIFLHP